MYARLYCKEHVFFIYIQGHSTASHFFVKGFEFRDGNLDLQHHDMNLKLETDQESFGLVWTPKAVALSSVNATVYILNVFDWLDFFYYYSLFDMIKLFNYMPDLIYYHISIDFSVSNWNEFCLRYVFKGSFYIIIVWVRREKDHQPAFSPL